MLVYEFENHNRSGKTIEIYKYLFQEIFDEKSIYSRKERSFILIGNYLRRNRDIYVIFNNDVVSGARHVYVLPYSDRKSQQLH